METIEVGTLWRKVLIDVGTVADKVSVWWSLKPRSIEKFMIKLQRMYGVIKF